MFSIKRIIAYFIDYLIVLTYIGILIFISVFLFDSLAKDTSFISPVKGQLLGFFTLTLPVFFYFYLSERGKYGATLGKRIMKLKVIPVNPSQKKKVGLRNILKFLPWEIAHTGIHWLFYYYHQQIELPVWISILLILPQIIVFAYLISVVKSKGKSSLYDHFSETKIVSSAT